MTYSVGAVERAMTIHQALLHALHGRQTWLQVADVIGLSPRTVRRWRARLEQFGVPGLLDRRRQTPSPRRVPLARTPARPPALSRAVPGLQCAALPPARPPGPRRDVLLHPREDRPPGGRAGAARAAPAAGIAAGASPAPASANCCTSMAAATAGSPSSRRPGTPCSSSWTMRRSRCSYAQLVEGGESTRAIMTALWAVFAQHGVARRPLHRSGPLGRPHAHLGERAGSDPPHAGRPRAAGPRASSTSSATPRRPAGAANGPIARCRIAW